MIYTTRLYQKSLWESWNHHHMVTKGTNCNGVTLKVSTKSTKIESVIEKTKDYENYKYEQHKLDQAKERKEGKHCPRWLTDDVEKMYIMPACAPAHEYICKRLDFSVHYQVKPSEKVAFEKALDSITNKEGCPNIIRVNEVMEQTEDKTFKDEFLKATTNVSPDEVPWDSINEAIKFLLTECKEDKTRGNICKDFGFTGDHNPDLKRNEPELRGLCCPNVHARTFDPKLPWIKDLFCYVSKRLIKLSEDFVDDLYGHKRSTVRDRLRHKLFASKIAEENSLDALRIALTTADICAKDHGDIGNDASDPRYTPSGVINIHVEVDNELERFAMIGYMKRGVADCLDRIEKHCDLIDDIEKFYVDIIKKEQSEYGPLNLIIPDIEDMPEKKVIEPSLDKFVSLYSGLASGAEKILTKYYGKTEFYKQLKYACAVAIPCNFSNYPEDYWHLCDLIHKDEYYLSKVIQSMPHEYKKDIETCMTECSLKSMEPLQLLNNLTVAIWWIKNNPVSTNRKARIQPAVNHLPKQHALQRSLDLLVELALMLKYRLPSYFNLGTSNQDIRYVYEMITGFLSDGTKKYRKGVYGCGDLTSQHLTGVCVILGIFDARLACHAEVPKTTKVPTFLYANYHYNAHTHDNDMREMLLALVNVIRNKHDGAFNAIKGEELVCRFVKWRKNPEQPSKYKDTICRGQHLFGLENIGYQRGKKKNVTIIRYYCKDGTKQVISEPLQNYIKWPNNPVHSQEILSLPLPETYWCADNLIATKTVAPKKANTYKTNQSCQRYRIYMPTLFDGKKKNLDPSEVTSKDLVICDDPAVMKGPLDYFVEEEGGEIVQVDLSRILKKTLQIAGRPDTDIVIFQDKQFEGYWHKMWTSGLIIPSNDCDAIKAPPLFPDPTFCLYIDKSSVIFEGKRYFSSKGAAKEYCILWYLKTYPATVLREGGEQATALYGFSPTNSKQNQQDCTKEQIGTYANSPTNKTSRSGQHITYHGMTIQGTSSLDDINLEFLDEIFENEEESTTNKTYKSTITKRSTRSSRNKTKKRQAFDSIPIEEDVMQISGIRCFCKRPNHNGSEKGKKRHPGFDPFMAAMKYKAGGMAYFMIDRRTGTRQSEIYLHWPERHHRINSSIMDSTKKLSTDVPVKTINEFLRIVGDNRADKCKRKSDRKLFKVQWADASVSWINASVAITRILNTTYQYAQQTNLLKEDGWSMLLKTKLSLENTLPITEPISLREKQPTQRKKKGQKNDQMKAAIKLSGQKRPHDHTVSFCHNHIEYSVPARQSYTPEEMTARFYTAADYQTFRKENERNKSKKRQTKKK